MSKKFRRVVLPFFIGTASLYISITFFFGVISGYLFGKYMAGGAAGEQGKIKSIRFSVGRYVIHLHHWFYVFLGMAIIFVSGMSYLFPGFIWGFGSGFAFQGIHCYDDWYKILIKKKH